MKMKMKFKFSKQKIHLHLIVMARKKAIQKCLYVYLSLCVQFLFEYSMYLGKSIGLFSETHYFDFIVEPKKKNAQRMSLSFHCGSQTDICLSEKNALLDNIRSACSHHLWYTKKAQLGRLTTSLRPGDFFSTAVFPFVPVPPIQFKRMVESAIQANIRWSEHFSVCKNLFADTQLCGNSCNW